MGFSFTGQVLTGAQVATANAVTTGEPDTGVVRDARPVTAAYVLGFPHAPHFVDAAASQYRTSVVRAPGTTTTEYLVWAANTADLTGPRDQSSSWWSEDGVGVPAPGTASVSGFQDGSVQIQVYDNGGRTLSRIYAVVVARGDQSYEDEGWIDPNDVDPANHSGQPRKGTTPYLTLYLSGLEQDPLKGVAYLTQAHLTLLSGGFSVERGDQIIAVHYRLDSAKFYWTRNDRYETRFAWDGRAGRWAPLKGSAPNDLGPLHFDTLYRMSPAVKNLPLDAYLSGDPLTLDAYAMIRIGNGPGATGSVPVNLIKVKPDVEVRQAYDFSLDPTVNGVVGQTNGILQFNPTFTALHAGQTLWYVEKSFPTDSTGIIGKMTDTELFLAPVPSPWDMPLIRFGSRHYLNVGVVMTEAELMAFPSIPEGSVGVAASTGRVRLSDVDVAKATSGAGFKPLYFEESVIYDGLSLSGEAQPTRLPVQLLDGTGGPAWANADALYIPDFQYLPVDSTTDSPRRGLGVSGVLDSPDGTGARPAGVGLDATVRPGGENTGDTTTGRIRQVEDGVSDSILYSNTGTLTTLIVVDYEADLPPHSFMVPEGTAYIAREKGAWGSKVVLGDVDKEKFGHDAMYFLQAALTPASLTSDARLFSRNRDIFRFYGTEKLYFAIDGAPLSWDASTLLAAHPGQAFFTADEVAVSINLGASGASAYDGRVVLASTNLQTGSVEIGWGTGGAEDLSGATALGFVPGWRADGGLTNWLPDSGVSLGLRRSPNDLDDTQAIPDFRATLRTDPYQVLTESIQRNPFYFLDMAPLLDVVGIEEDVFFAIQSTATVDEVPLTTYRNLNPYTDVMYRFGQKKFDWVREGFTTTPVHTSVKTLNLGASGIAPESLDPAVGGGLYVSADGGPYVLQTLGTDYLLPQDGVPGTAVLTEKFLKLLSSGASGTLTTGSPLFSDAHADFSAVTAGDVLAINQVGQPTALYTVVSMVTSTMLYLSPTPGLTAQTVQWDLYDGLPDTVYDPALIADQGYEEFNHLPQETMVVRVLTPIPATLVANMSAALAKGRTFNLRFGMEAPTAPNEVSLTALQQIELGVLANGVLNVPNTGTLGFSLGAFTIRVGTKYFTQGVDLLGVASFSTNPAGAEYLLVDNLPALKGQLKFGSAVLTAYASAKVHYAELFLPAASLVAGQGEYDPHTGKVNVPTADLTANTGKQLYFVEQLITEKRTDVATNPMLGAFSTNTPVSKGSSVEVSYWGADLEGRKIGNLITEFLPVFVRNEVSIRERPNVYLFNKGKGHVIDQAIDPLVYIGPMQQNYGRTDFVVDYPASLPGQGRLTFVSHEVPDNVDVKVTYAVYDMLGGERSFEVSTKPVYRPPFFIKAAQERFGLRGNRLTEFTPGQMLRIGQDCFYIKALQYYPQTTGRDGDITSVTIFPPTTNEVGSRAPGNDVVSVITHEPITTVVDPDGASPVATTAAAGFMSTVNLTVFPFEPVSTGQSVIVFRGNLTQFAVSGHILEIGGRPYTIATVDMDAHGTRTAITITTAFQKGFAVADAPTVKLSYRPVYPPNAKDLLGVGAVLDTEPYALMVFDPNAVGSILVPDVDYTLDTMTGNVHLTTGMLSGQKYLMAYTRHRSLQAYVEDGIAVVPKYQATYLSLDTPSESNGLLGGTLVGTYTYASPDAFYFRAVPLKVFLGEMVEEVIREIRAKQPASGALIYPHGSVENWKQGRVGVGGERKHLQDKDRAARTFLDYTNNVIVAFEQVSETISGGIVGDRDGKFRFRIGRDQDYPTPGYEDDITGLLTPHTVWTDVVNEARGNPDYFGLPSDWIVSPESLDVVNGGVTGYLPHANYLNQLIDRQKSLVYNDVDDLLLERVTAKQFFFTATSPHFHLSAHGVFRAMWEPGRLSRLFPYSTEAFFLTMPGVGYDPTTDYPGAYTAGRDINGTEESTTGTVIGQLHNPVLGDISAVQSAHLHKRKARARIWRYCPQGIPAGALGLLSPAADITEPVLIAMPALLKDVPIRPDTGYPDALQFLSQGGTVPDIQAGDPAMVVPGFAVGDQIAWGKPDGTILPAFNGFDPVLVYTTHTYTGLFVRDVQFGCVMRLQAADGTPITDANAVWAGYTTAESYPITEGDSLLVGAVSSALASPPDPPEFATFEALSQGIDTYRSGFDINVQPDGSLLDVSMKSKADGSFWALKEMFGQNPPQPMTSLEGSVDFVFTGQNPLKIPALEGKIQDDSGDYQLPYVASRNTELTRLSQASAGLSLVLSTRDTLGHAVYPDEIVGTDGVVATWTWMPIQFPATLKTALTLMPGYGPGAGPLQSYDLLLVQTDSPNGLDSAGALGIQSVGAVITGNPSSAEPPRFITATKAPSTGSTDTGDPLAYILTNAMVYQNPYYVNPPAPGSVGVVVTEDTNSGYTTLDFTSNGMIFDNGLGTGGGFNDIVAAHTANKVIIKLYAPADTSILNGVAGVNPLPSSVGGGEVALTIEIHGDAWSVTDYQGNVLGLVGVSPLFTGHVIRLQGVGIIPWGPGPGTPAQWFLSHTVNMGPAAVYSLRYGLDVSVSIDTSAGYSSTAWISPDRLIFNEICQLTYAQYRGSVHAASGLSLETGLSIIHTTVGQTAGSTILSTINSHVNGYSGGLPIPLTFLPNNGYLVGFWQPRVGIYTERGSLKVSGFEGYTATTGNLPITGTGITFSAVPSNTSDTVGTIFTGTGKTASHFNTDLSVEDRIRYDSRVTDITPSAGAASRVEAGDLLVIKASANLAHPATHQAGTYLVRHAIEPTGGHPWQEVASTTVAGYAGGWCPLVFPTVTSFDPGTGILIISDPATTEWGTNVGGVELGFPAIGSRIYVIRDVAALASADSATFAKALVSAQYTGVITLSGWTPVFTLTDYKDAQGGVLTASAFAALLDKPYSVSGMTYWPVQVTGAGLPANNCVGFDSACVAGPHAADGAMFGFHHVKLTPPLTLSAAAPLNFTGNDAAGPGEYLIRKTSAAGQLVPMEGAVMDVASMQYDVNRSVYPWVVRTLDATAMTDAQWHALNIPAGSAGGGGSLVSCVLPGTRMTLGDGTNAGFYAQAGVFLEPTFPRSALSLKTTYPHVVDASHNVPSPTGLDDWQRPVGMRDSLYYREIGFVNVPDEVSFEVRRIRRFHEVNEVVSRELEPLRFAYEIRRGRISTYTSGNKQQGQVHCDFTMDYNSSTPSAPLAPDVWNDGKSYHGTNLGGFLNPDVNVHAGDTFRLLDMQGNVQEEARIVAVKDGSTLVLAAPGLRTNSLAGMRFEVFLKTAPVPHEQSCEELLALLTDREICRTFANWTTESGGYVPDITGGTVYANAVNRLCDDLNATGIGGKTFTALGVRAGDIVIIDSAGSIPPASGHPLVQEHGSRPVGDEGVSARLGIGEYVQGIPSRLDDNRGFYRVKKVVDSASPPYLLVDPVHTYAGEENSPVVFGDATHAFAVYPSVDVSPLKQSPYPGSGSEAQNALRPTLKRQGATGSFVNRVDGFVGHSIRPFSYRVIRPSSMFSAKAVDLVLMMRERLQSLMEMLRKSMDGRKSGTYFVFQRDEHLLELGGTTDPDLGLGYPSNLYLEAVGGRTDVVPYANNSTCLSLLDRRVWIHDSRLDSLTDNSLGGMRISNPGDTSYTAFTDPAGSSILPVLPERIDEILDRKDKFRSVRYVWLAYRTHQILGTLAALKRLADSTVDQQSVVTSLAAVKTSAEKA